MLLVEKGKAIDVFRNDILSQTIQERLLADIDVMMPRLESGQMEEPIEEPRQGHI